MYNILVQMKIIINDMSCSLIETLVSTSEDNASSYKFWF